MVRNSTLPVLTSLCTYRVSMEGFSDSHLERELIAEATKLQRALWQALVNVGKPTTPVRDLLDLYNRANDQPTRDLNQKGAQYTRRSAQTVV